MSAFSPGRARSSSVDTLRGVAILLVFCRHSEGAFLISNVGWIGVDLFFVLSGFLVSGLLFREFQETGDLNATRFLIRRGLKIYPHFYLFVLVSIGVFLWAGEFQLSRLLKESFFIQNYTPGLWAYTWSLGVEEHFYLVLVFALVFVVKRHRMNSLPKYILLASGIVLALRCLTWLVIPDTSGYIHVFPTHLRIDSLLAGVFLSYYHAFHPQTVSSLARWQWLPQLSIALVAPVAFLEQSEIFMSTIGFSMIAVGLTLLLLLAIQPANRKAGVMAGIGRVSYGFYLWHGMVLFVWDRLRFPVNPFVSIPLTFTITLALAYASTRYVEAPFLRFRDRRWPSMAWQGRFANSESPSRILSGPQPV